MQSLQLPASGRLSSAFHASPLEPAASRYRSCESSLWREARTLGAQWLRPPAFVLLTRIVKGKRSAMKKFCLLMGVFMLAGVFPPTPEQPPRVSFASPSVQQRPRNFVLPETTRTPLRLAPEGTILSVVATKKGTGISLSGMTLSGVSASATSRSSGSVRQVFVPQQAGALGVADPKLPVSDSDRLGTGSRTTRRPHTTIQGPPSFPPLRPRSGGAPSRTTRETSSECCVRLSHSGCSRDCEIGVDGLRHNESHAVAWDSGRCKRQLQQGGVYGTNTSTHNFLSGPTLHGKAEWRTAESVRSIPGWNPIHILAQSLGFSASSVNFAIQPGGGVDIKLSDSIAVHVQLDYRSPFHDGFHSGAWRFAPGIVISRGRKSVVTSDAA